MKTWSIVIGFSLVFATLVGIILWYEREDSTNIFEYYELEGLSIQEKVERLDQLILNPDWIAAGVRANELEIKTLEGDFIYSLEDELFYLSFAPYINSTHPCFNHNLVTCRGELAEKTVYVHIETALGEVLYNEEMTMYENGFKGVWLPRNQEMTITIQYNDLEVQHTFVTTDTLGTCLTEELRLS